MSVMVIYGNSKESLLIREQEIVQEYRANGYEIRTLTDRDGVVDEAFSSGLFDIDPVLVVVKNPTKVKGLKPYLQDTKGCEVLVVHSNERLPKLLEGFPVQEHNEPKYDDEKVKWASGFLHNYIKRMGKDIDPKLCFAVVRKAGTDVGVLRWEAHKYVMAAGEGEITAKLVAGLYSELSDAYTSELINAVASGDAKSFLKVCERMEKSASSDLTMSVTNGLLFYQVKVWLEIAVRLESKETVETISHELGLNPYRLTNFLLPQVKSLGLKRLRGVVRVLYECEDAVLSGARSPWGKFKASMMGVLGG